MGIGPPNSLLPPSLFFGNIAILQAPPSLKGRISATFAIVCLFLGKVHPEMLGNQLLFLQDNFLS